MALTQDNVNTLCRRASELKAYRGNWESHWQSIAQVILPPAATFTTTRSPGERMMQFVFDSTPIQANQLLASGLFSLLTNPTQEWFLWTTEDPNLADQRNVALWLEQVSKICFFEMNRPAAGLITSLHECYLDYGAFGTTVMFVTEDVKNSRLVFRTIPLSEAYIAENENGSVDTLYRDYTRTVKQLIERFGLDGVSDEVKDAYQKSLIDKKVPGVHAMQPKGDMKLPGNMAVTSAYIDLESRFVMSDRGFQEQPFMAPRFYKVGYDAYGRGPGEISLPDVQMLNEVMKTTIRAAQKMVDPPLLMPDEGFLHPLRTLPGGVNYFRAASGASNLVDQLPSTNPNIGMDMVQEIRARIRETFFVDQLQLNQGPQMTATEVLQRTEEKLRLMGPLLGRLQTELLDPLLNRVFGLLWRAGKIPPPPAELENQNIKPVYTSPIARAQEQLQANGIVRMTQVMAPYIQLKPETLDNYNVDYMSRAVGDMFGVSRNNFMPGEIVAMQRQQRAQAEQAKADAENLAKQGQGADSMARAMDTAGITEDQLPI